MNFDEKLDAKVKRTGNRVVMTVEDAHREKMGIARLEYDLVSSAPPIKVSPPPGQLIRDLKETVEILGPLERRIHALKVKKATLGSAFPAGEDVELDEAREEAEELRRKIREELELAGSTLAGQEKLQLEEVKEEIFRLGAQKRSEGKSSFYEARPYSKVDRGQC